MDMETIQLQVIAQEQGFIIEKELSEQRIAQDDRNQIDEIIALYHNDKAACLLSLGFLKHAKWFSPSFAYLVDLCHTFCEELRRTPQLEELREAVQVTISDEQCSFLLLGKPYFLGEAYLDEPYLQALFSYLLQQYQKEIQQYAGTVAQYFHEHGQKEPVGRVFFHLVENTNGDEPFAFLATYSSLQESGKLRQLPLLNALDEYSKDSLTLIKLLSTVHKATEKSAFINEISNNGELMHPLKLTTDEAYTILKEIPLYEECGIVCRVPKWFKQKINRPQVNVTTGENPTSILGMETLLNFHVNISIDGEKISIEELRALAHQSDGLALIKGKWVEIHGDELQRILSAYERIQLDLENGLTLKEALRLQLSMQEQEEDIEIHVSNGEWLHKLFSSKDSPQANKVVAHHVQAQLRPYQEVGVQWLHYMQQLGFGACLADDMGLGKTLQVIALLSMKENQHKKTLLVVPASLIHNWQSELQRFAPKLRCAILHPSNKNLDDTVLLQHYDIIITTYSMCTKYTWVMEHTWDILVLDEAQAIKNPNTKQTKTVKAISANYRLALSGTPIENKLMDLWSLFDFLNSGLLGSPKEFKGFVKRLQSEEHTQGYARLKEITSPFILRRLKTDKTIIHDLPDKIEMKTYANLSKQQISLYQDLVDTLKVKLMSSDGIQRKGLVLSSLIKFKQICNHPDEYLGETCFEEAESGKFIRLKEICEAIYQHHERVLVFTQFKEMVAPLTNYLETIFHTKGVSLDGSTSIKKRQEAVETFQGDDYVPFMVLSIKAGGVGLNLTKASHVVHFDRWWNPAVENQATDRAFRIGQQNNVVVHKFICEGTVEEKIDQIIESKMKLSMDVMEDSKETWITEMNNDELLQLFDLKEG